VRFSDLLHHWRMSARVLLFLASLPKMVCTAVAAEPEKIYADDFTAAPASPWKWLRENSAAWRTGAKGLEVKVEPGNMWGPPNDAKNVLIRPVLDTSTGELEITVTVTNQPTNQYEQVDLVWYYDDSHMVKIGQEMVDGKMSIVMGREEKDRTRTMAILPLQTNTVKLRLLVKGATIRGQYQPDGETDWKDAGTCTAPVPENGKPHISLQFYQGSKAAEHWARATGFTVNRRPGPR
jgi:regulation of enolase protein 1 (concanavalin A-like superfamily)